MRTITKRSLRLALTGVALFAKVGEDVSAISITREQARRFLIRRQKYRAEGTNWVGVDGVCAAIRHLGAVQIDPVVAFERNHHHALFSRVKGYRPEMLEQAIYERREAFEYYCNALCVIPMAEYPYFQHRMHELACDLEVHPDLHRAAEAVMARITADGPTSSRQFDSGQKVSGWWDADNQAATKIEKHALDYLHLTGQLMIAGRDGTARRYDLPERVVPRHYLEREITSEEYREFMLDKFLRCYGLSQTSLFRFGWFKGQKADKKALLADFIAAGRAVEVMIQGAKRRYYCHRACLSELLQDEHTPIAELAVIVPPLDNLLWDRDVIADIFQFDYRWEVYVPAAKRRYGYYVLPILFGDELVGRIELRAQREQGELAVTGLWWEKKSVDAETALVRTVGEIGEYLGLRLAAAIS
ncbi:MAG: winged helix-turn-helix domain-containing protein [Bacillota bacterium]